MGELRSGEKKLTLIVESRPLVAAGLISILDDSGMWKIESVPDSKAAASFLEHDGATSLIIIGEPAAQSYSDTEQAMLSRRLRNRFPHIPIVLLGDTLNPANARQLRSFGTTSSIHLGEQESTILQTLRNAAGDPIGTAEGQPGNDFRENGQLPDEECADTDIAVSTIVRLTRREKDVLSIMVKGMTNKEIAGALHLSPETVKTHISTLLKKSGASSRHRLIAAISSGEIKIDDFAQ
ncbi:MAG: LuxR C-terminal-related transcriptional regulator [Thermoleophilia bacterium]